MNRVGFQYKSIDLFNVVVFIRATDHVITVMPPDQKLCLAKTFPVPLIPIDSSQILLGKINHF